MKSGEDTGNHKAQAEDGDFQDHQQSSFFLSPYNRIHSVLNLTHEVVGNVCGVKDTWSIVVVNFMYQHN